jgi:hypothetical protein
MKKASDIIIQPEEVKQVSVYSEEEQNRVRGFVLSILSIYGNKSDSMRRDLVPVLRIYAPDILKLSEKDYQLRLQRVKELRQAGHDDYKWPADALAKATGKMEILNHDYSQYYAVGSDARAMQSAPMIEHKPTDPGVAKKHLNNLKGIFDE